MKIKENERIDEIGFGGLKLIQAPDGFCYGIDAVLLADFAAKIADLTHAETLVDLGSGNGVIPLVIAEKAPLKRAFGVEVQEDYADRASRSAELNGKPEISIVSLDVLDLMKPAAEQTGTKAELFRMRGSFDLVTSNPPYVERNSGISNDANDMMIARCETTADIFDFFRASSALLRKKGSFCLIHRPQRLSDIFAASRETGLEPKEIQFIRPKKDKEPNLVLLRCVKAGGRELHYLPDLVVYDEEGRYTPEVLAAYGREK